ncbi:MAG: hypothetical protein FWD17_11300 [Polyangiaceae bacterium]|nr:hypothetical protein [Polyangiaceae bacterium]
MKLYVSAAITTTVLLGGFAVARAAGSPASFHPATPADAAAIYNNGSYLYNQSTSAAVVIADLGTGVGGRSVTVSGWTQGNFSYTTCSIYYASLTDSSNRGNSGTSGRGGTVGSWDQSAQGPVSMSVSSGTPPSGPTYSYQLVCTLAGLQPGLSAEQIFGWQ